jgi:ribosomal protein L11 methylase PrmA
MSPVPSLWKIAVTCSSETAGAIEELLAKEAAAVTVIAPPRTAVVGIEALYYDEPPKPALSAFRAKLELLAALHKTEAPEIRIEKVGNLDWLKKVAADFPPLAIGRWTIYGGAHSASVKNRRMKLRIDATNAFGTGEHPTTRGCLLMLERVLKKGIGHKNSHPPLARLRPSGFAGSCSLSGEAAQQRRRTGGSKSHCDFGEGSKETPSPAKTNGLLRKPKFLLPLPSTYAKASVDLSSRTLRSFSVGGQGERDNMRMLDIGCGSGILAMAFAKTTHGKAVAVDLDPDSVAIAKANVLQNGLQAYVLVGKSRGYASALVRRHSPYGLIMANIFARPLCEMAKDLKRHLKPGGFAILSGILNHQANAVLAAHRAQGLVLRDKMTLGEWTTLALQRPNVV